MNCEQFNQEWFLLSPFDCLAQKVKLSTIKKKKQQQKKDFIYYLPGNPIDNQFSAKVAAIQNQKHSEKHDLQQSQYRIMCIQITSLIFLFTAMKIILM